MTSDREPLDPEDLRRALDVLPDWRSFPGSIQTCYRAPSARAALDLVAAVGEAAEAAGHHPDLDWRYDRVFVRTTSHDAGNAVTGRDLRLAAEVSELARRTGAVAEPGAVRAVAIAVDTPDPERLREAWATALGYGVDDRGALADPWGRGPDVRFHRTGTPAASRLHVDVHVPADEAEQIAAQVADRGAPVRDDHSAPARWEHADADGNRLCVRTTEDRPAP